MRGKLQFSCLLGACVFSTAAAMAQEPTRPAPANERPPEAAGAKGTNTDAAGAAGGVGAGASATVGAGATSTADPQMAAAPPAPPPPPPPPAEPPPEKKADEWQFVTSGYFRGPIAIGLSDRPDPNSADPNSNTAPSSTQMAYAPNRLLDAGYYSFGYTRLQEQDWGEIYFTEKRKHVAATLAVMGYWYPWAGYERPATGWLPAQGWVTLDSDFQLGNLKPKVELKAGIFTHKWGIFGVYDTYMFGRFHQAGESLQLTVPLSPELELRLLHGIGTNRNGSATNGTGLTMLHYAHVGINYNKMVDVGLYYNNSWTSDPSLFAAPPGTTPSGGGAYSDAKEANMTVLGGEIKLDLPTFGRLWLTPGYVSVKNGWALSQTVELMHSPGGGGIAGNYLGWRSDGRGTTGSGSMVNLGFLYENSLSKILGQTPADLPDLRLSAFGMLAKASRDVPTGSAIPDSLTQFKWGADLTLQALDWLAFMGRYDWVNVDMDNSGNNFSVITPRVIFQSHFLSNESIWIQYSRYFYGDKMLLATSETQPYRTPDHNVIKIQANMSW